MVEATSNGPTLEAKTRQFWVTSQSGRAEEGILLGKDTLAQKLANITLDRGDGQLVESVRTTNSVNAYLVLHDQFARLAETLLHSEEDQRTIRLLKLDKITYDGNFRTDRELLEVMVGPEYDLPETPEQETAKTDFLEALRNVGRKVKKTFVDSILAHENLRPADLAHYVTREAFLERVTLPDAVASYLPQMFIAPEERATAVRLRKLITDLKPNTADNTWNTFEAHVQKNMLSYVNDGEIDSASLPTEFRAYQNQIDAINEEIAQERKYWEEQRDLRRKNVELGKENKGLQGQLDRLSNGIGKLDGGKFYIKAEGKWSDGQATIRGYEEEIRRLTQERNELQRTLNAQNPSYEIVVARRDALQTTLDSQDPSYTDVVTQRDALQATLDGQNPSYAAVFTQRDALQTTLDGQQPPYETVKADLATQTQKAQDNAELAGGLETRMLDARKERREAVAKTVGYETTISLQNEELEQYRAGEQAQ